MQFTLSPLPLVQQKTNCLILPIIQQASLTKKIKPLDAMWQQQLSQLIQSKDFIGESGQAIYLFPTTTVGAKRLLLIGAGDKTELTARQFRDLLKTIWIHLFKISITEASLALDDIKVKNHDRSWMMREIVLSLYDALYQFESFKSKKKKLPTLNKLNFITEQKLTPAKFKTLINQAQATANSITLVKNLANMPPNICNPTYLADEARALAKRYAKKLHVTVLDEKQMQKLGMGSFLAVSQGSDSPGKLVTIEYQGGKAKTAPLAFIGKGITFDTGGNCIKPSVGMMGMKYDMCGAATVLGIMQLCAELELPINVIGVMAFAENMLSGHASRLGDIFTSLSGLTIEMTNTDAEGRLVLADAMTYTLQKFKPRQMMTIATLTGAAIVALGNDTSALLSNNDSMAKQTLAAGLRAEDRAWQLPLYEEYFDHLKSEYADMINASLTPVAGTIVAACFLSKFATDCSWVHLDVAGTATIPGRQAKSSGRPLPLIAEYLFDYIK